MLKNGRWYREKHIVSARDFDRQTLCELFAATKAIKTLLGNAGGRQILRGIIRKQGEPLFCRILYDGPSTRTISSFEDALRVLGGTSIAQPLIFSSWAKKESLRSIARVIAPRCDLLVIRHDKKPDAAREMADTVEKYNLSASVINAGDGNREHPTQMLLDLYTIWERKQGAFERGELTYALVGDLADSRTIHSLLLGLGHFGGTVLLVGPEEENIPAWLTRELTRTPALCFEKTSDLRAVAAHADVFYFTRLQTNLKKKKISAREKKRYAEQFGASDAVRATMKQDAVALHPLPHGSEYPEEIDQTDARFLHYTQVDNGVPARAGLIVALVEPQRISSLQSIALAL